MVSLCKEITTFLRRRNLETQQSTAIFYLCLRKNSVRKITLLSSFSKAPFQNVFLSTRIRKAGVSKSFGLKSVFENLRFRDVLVWTLGLTVEIKLRFQISAASECGRCLIWIIFHFKKCRRDHHQDTSMKLRKQILYLSILEITNFTKELQDFAAKMVNTLREAGDAVRKCTYNWWNYEQSCIPYNEAEPEII